MYDNEKIKTYTAANRAAWNEVTPIHQKARKTNYEKEFKNRDYSNLDEVLSEKLIQCGIKDKDVAQVCCNNGSETLSMICLGARSVVGFDISDEAIKEGQKLAKISGRNGIFVRTNIYDIGHDYDNSFDLILITIGALAWIPDLNRYFEIVTGMLKPNGSLVIYESHPFLDLFATEGEEDFDAENPTKIVYSYFKDDPWVNEDGIDYIGKTLYKSKVNYCFSHNISKIINAVIKNKIELLEFNEYPHNLDSNFQKLDGESKIPMSYLLIGRKRAENEG